MISKAISSYTRQLGCLALALFGLQVSAADGQEAPRPSQSVAMLETVYVADATEPWFVDWFGARVDRQGPLFRPDVRTGHTDDLLAAVAQNPRALGLVSRTELTGAGDAALGLRGAPSGVRVCAALMVRADSGINTVGDLLLLPPEARMTATPDMLGFAGTLATLYPFLNNLVFVEATREEALLALSEDESMLAIISTVDDSRLDLPESLPPLHPLPVTELAARALAGSGFAPGGFDRSWPQSWLPSHGVKTVCDEIMIVTAKTGLFVPERFTVSDGPALYETVAASDLVSRIVQAVQSLGGVLNAGREARP